MSAPELAIPNDKGRFMTDLGRRRQLERRSSRTSLVGSLTYRNLFRRAFCFLQWNHNGLLNIDGSTLMED